MSRSACLNLNPICEFFFLQSLTIMNSCHMNKVSGGGFEIFTTMAHKRSIQYRLYFSFVLFYILGVFILPKASNIVYSFEKEIQLDMKN